MIPTPQIPLEIDYDWSRMIRIYDVLIEKHRSGFFKDTTYRFPHIPDLEAHDIGKYGTIVTSRRLTPYEDWYVWTGLLLDTVFPWTQQLKDHFEQHNIDFVDFSLSRHFHSIKQHVDRKTAGVAEQGHCNLNYIIESDPDARSFFESTAGVCFYPSPVNTAWLLDSSVPHWVENEGPRTVFQLRFHSPYQQVLDHLCENPIKLS